jgi:glycosyltransferase involved in cell wall biosynthesis
MKMISAVMCTYGRFSCVERALNCFLSQTYPNKELIIYNTDEESPYSQDLSEKGVIIVNCGIDSITNEPYTNVGAIRRDALMFAKGDYVVTYDDDDIYMPYFMQQAIDRMGVTGLSSFKPEKSFFYSGGNLCLVKNTLEASVIADINKIREYGYLLETGKEGLSWYTKMRDNKELDENDSFYLPSYCFNWNDGAEMLAPHKQSGDINNIENFENHKKASFDKVNRRQLKIHGIDYMNDVVFRDYYYYLYCREEELDNTLVDLYLY